MFEVYLSSIGLLRMLSDLTRSKKFKIAAFKTQLVEKISTKFQRRYQCFRGPPIQKDY